VQVEATTSGPLATDADTIVVGVFEGEDVAHDVGDGALAALLDSGEARRDFKQLAVTHAEGRRFVLVGLGSRPDFDSERARVAAAAAHGRARELGARALCWEVPHHVGEEVVAGLVQGTLLHAHRFRRYKGDVDPKPGVERLIVSAHHDIAAAVQRAAVVTSAQNRARDLGNTPANDLPPAELAAYAERLEGVTVTVLDGAQIRAAGMGAFTAVAQGSAQDARMIIIGYEGAPSARPRLGLVGKGVTFDSGGLSIKPAAKMYEMKFDMCGAAAVIEAIAALAELRAPVRVLGVVGATENLPSGSAVKPGDIVTALDGTTIEVNNTDAEGRLVLADCLSYARREGCDWLIDVATLTGGIVVALGSSYAGMMSNDDALAGQLQAAAEEAGELVWRMPLHPEYAEMVEGRYAQLTNLSERRGASPITAAEFLHHFVGPVPWAHLDVAGTAYDVKRDYITGKGASGFGVRLLVDVAERLAGSDSPTA
jgi:leucyl aminopeptidase